MSRFSVLPVSRARLFAARTTGDTRRFSLWDLIGLARQRRQLSELDPHILKDIGLERADVMTESRRKPWDVPAHWHAKR